MAIFNSYVKLTEGTVPIFFKFDMTQNPFAWPAIAAPVFHPGPKRPQTVDKCGCRKRQLPKRIGQKEAAAETDPGEDIIFIYIYIY